jgi:hypothetical protein
MGTDWADVTNDPLASGPDSITGKTHQEPRERDSEKWCMPDPSDNMHSKVVKTPEDLRILPQDLDLFPQEVNADEDSWTDNPIQSSEGFDAFYWADVDAPT